MVFEEFQYIIWPAINILAVGTAIFAVLVVYNLMKQVHKEKKHTQRVLLRVFMLIAVGTVLLVMSMLTWNFYVFGLGIEFPRL